MRSFVFWLLAITFIASSFSNGLYFDHSFYPFQLVIFSLTLLVLVYTILTREKLKLGKYIIILLLPIILLFSLFVSEAPKGTIDEVLRWITYGCYFLLLYWALQEDRNRKLAVPVLNVSGFVIIGYSILAFLQITPLEGAVVNERLGGVFQYPNTFGIVAAFFFMMYLIVVVKNNLSEKMFVFYTIPAVLYSVGLFLSESRGAMIVLLIVGIGILFFLSVKEQVKYIITTILTGIIGIITYLIINPEKGILSLVVLFLATAVHVLIMFALEKYSAKFEFKFLKQSYVPIAAVVLFVLAVLDLLFKGLFYKLLNQVFHISFSFDTFFERFMIWKDALKAAGEAPILGYGGDSWRVIFTQFQSYPYQTNNLHNGYLEWLIGAGLIGLIIFFVVMAYFIIKVKKTKKLLVLAPLAVIFLHSLIDFNFSYGTVWLLIFWMLAFGVKQEDTQHKLVEKYEWVLSLAMCALLIVPSFFAFRFIQANQYYENAVQTNNLTEQLVYLETAVEYDPYDIQKLQGLGQTYSQLYLQTNNSFFLDELNEIINRMEELEPKNHVAQFVGIQLLENTGQLEKAAKKTEQTLSFDRFNALLYEKIIQLNTDLSIKKSSVDLAQEALEDFEAYKSQYEEVTKLIAPDKMDIFNSRDFIVSDSAKYLAGLAAYITGDYNLTLQIVESIENESEDLNRKIDSLKTAVYKKTNNQKAEQLMNLYKDDNEYNTLLSELGKL